MPALLPIILTVSHVVLAADTIPIRQPQWACQGERLWRPSVMKTMHGPSSSRTGLGTTQPSALIARTLLGSIVRPATLNY